MNRSAKKLISLAVFLFIICFTFILPGFGLKINKATLIVSFVIPVCLTLFLYRFDFPLFFSSLFFTINFILRPINFKIFEALNINFPALFHLLPIIFYILLIVLSKKVRDNITWLKKDNIDKRTIYLIITTIILSCIGLVIWAVFIQKDLGQYSEFFPDHPIYLLIFEGIAFALINSVIEEMVARGILWDGFDKLFSNKYLVILFQALVFGIWHQHGFPGGISGIIMVFIWSILLGLIRLRSGGILAPIVAHFFADFAILMITLLVLF